MYDLFAHNSPKTRQAIALLEEGDIIHAVQLWGEVMQTHGKCVLFCREHPQSKPIHVCASCFERCLWNTAFYAPGDNKQDQQANPFALAQKLRDWLFSTASSDASQMPGKS